MVKGFSPTQIALHWVVALLILYQLLMGDDMSRLWWSVRNGGTATPTVGSWVHIIFGSLVLVLALWRLALRFTRGVPEAPPEDSAFQVMAAQVVHVGLYVLMLALPVTGLLAWFGGVTALGGLHGGILKALLWIFIAAHVLAALYHHFVLKDGLLNRMRKPG